MCNLRFADLIWLIWFGDFDDIFQIFPNDQSITMGLWGFMFDFLGPQDFHCSPWESLEMVKSHGFQYWKKNHPLVSRNNHDSIDSRGSSTLRKNHLCVLRCIRDETSTTTSGFQIRGVYPLKPHPGGKKTFCFGYLQKTIKIAKWTVPPKSHGIANNTLW